MNDRTFVVVGSLTRDAPYFQGARGKGITVFAFDEHTGQLTRLAEKGGVDNPTYLSVHEGNRCVYANSEVFGWNEGTVSAYRLDPHDGRLTYLNKQSALGSILAHNSLDGTLALLLQLDLDRVPLVPFERELLEDAKQGLR